MAEQWTRLVAEWVDAGVIDSDTAARIRAFEQRRAGSTRWGWPLWLALAGGGLMLGSGVLLFVAAHWDNLSPTVRFLLVLGGTGLFHTVAAAVSERRPALASTLHAVGTLSLGAGIFLAGQIFNMAEHWPGGIMLWAIGAAIGWVLLRDSWQLALVALLVPGWLASEWIVATELDMASTARIAAAGILLTSVTYFTAITRHSTTRAPRPSLLWIGGLALIPAALAVATLAEQPSQSFGTVPTGPVVLAIGWFVALGFPLLLAAALKGAEAWTNVLATLWVVALLGLHTLDRDVPLYAWWAIGAAGLVAWGVRDGRNERINMGAAIFAAVVMAFYFSEVMTKLGRSASLIGVGIVFLLGGWALERARRHFVQSAKDDHP